MVKKLVLVHVAAVMLLAISLSLLLLPSMVHAQSINWIPLDCGPESSTDATPQGTNLVNDYGNGDFATYVAWDSDFLYFRERVNGDPTHSTGNGFVQNSWTALLSDPSVDPFRYQYMVSLNGNAAAGSGNDTVELWDNLTSSSDVNFNPIFNDPADTQLAALDYTTGGPTIAPYSGQLAISTTAGTSIGGNADYFVYWSIPIQTLIDEGVISQASDLNTFRFFLATSANANNYNKDVVNNCTFAPAALLDLDKSVDPDAIATGSTQQVGYTVVVTNVSSEVATGVKIRDDDFAACLVISDTVGISTSGLVTNTNVVTADPLLVEIDGMHPGSVVTVTLTANGSACGAGNLVNTATTFATNAPLVDDTATLVVGTGPTSVGLASFEARSAAILPRGRIAWQSGVVLLALFVAIGIGGETARRRR